MFLIIIGIFAIIASFFMASQDGPAARFSTITRIVAVVLVIIGASLSMFKVVESGEVGVKTLFGKVNNDVLYSGLNIVNPMMKVTTFDVKTQNYTMSGVNDEGGKVGDDAIRVLSADGLEVIIDLSVLFKVKPSAAPEILRTIGTDYLDKIVRPIARTAIRDNAVSYDAVALYSSKRDEFQNKIFNTINKSFIKRGLELEQLLVRNITLPASVKTTIESKINAEQDAQKMTFVLQKERQEAERKRVEAQGIADYQRILSTGLSDKQLQYETIKAQKEIALSPNTKVIIMGNSKNAPIILGGN
ncbi:MAG: band 7 protein [Sphingobacteriales bacterium 17-39-43]|uniref:prohibitin family protein n=1 Tax=Daejeonella sp. TaxID=2805397 RepID=UPI000BDDEBF6|nr:prohibitin family protein [Daejeonella sp.]OYZ30780.1 MAG: band 7 protein [Sphingobacteriales bacterium 16-39-50]OZA23600.1 MAG: band 7 protein [Sphingobacteriales bacterium 17-39-43]HQT23797.1 prohibitin family protein [Daejeonella sp.]HQT58450.1 prohibitin family protein [Daejeonella sp.]